MVVFICQFTKSLRFVFPSSLLRLQLQSRLQGRPNLFLSDDDDDDDYSHNDDGDGNDSDDGWMMMMIAVTLVMMMQLQGCPLFLPSPNRVAPSNFVTPCLVLSSFITGKTEHNINIRWRGSPPRPGTCLQLYERLHQHYPLPPRINVHN